MKPIIDVQRARYVAFHLYEAFQARSGLLSETDDLVENQIPSGVETLSREHALFLFYIVSNDHGMKSTRLYARAKGLFLEKRQLFEPYRVIEDYQGPEDMNLIESTGKQLSTRYPRETARSWYANSARLVERYQGDPRELFRSTTDARILMKAITAFRGYGPKTGGMLLRAIIGLGFADVTGVEDVLVPVDIHDSRISYFTGILKLDEPTVGPPSYYDYVPQVQKGLLEACNTLGIKWLDVDRALWLIGSRGCVTKRCHLCPLNNICMVGKDVLAERAHQLSMIDGQENGVFDE